MRKFTFIILLLISIIDLKAQDYSFRKNINKDSLFEASLKKLPEAMREDYTKEYKNGNDQSKEFLLFMIAMSKSSKKELIDNYEINQAEIKNLKTEYFKLVPKNYVVEIEFEPESKVLIIPEQITIKIYKNKNEKLVQENNNLELVSQNWHLKLNSKELNDVLKSLNWTNETLKEIKNLLTKANCISIQNGNIITIGFARSGMGKYSYNIFKSTLTPKQIKEYNNGCQYIYYKDSIILEYGGGAVGPQCFEK